jgi:hypothetical protein
MLIVLVPARLNNARRSVGDRSFNPLQINPKTLEFGTPH